MVRFGLIVGAVVLVASWIAIESSAGAATISAVSVAHDVTDFSPAGFRIGGAGSWFANFNASAPATNAPVPQNAANSLPSWLAVNFDSTSATYSFPADQGDGKPYAVSNGGQPGFNSFTLPNSATGPSGQLVDTRMTASGTDTLIKDLTFGQGAPTSILFRVVLDNAPLAAATVVDRLRATYRLPQDGNTIVRALFENAEVVNNGIADVYTFRLDGIEPTGYLALQIRTTASNLAGGIAGFAFDLVPEPMGATLLAIGIVAYLSVAGRIRAA